jgi:hypothetical protein
MAKATSLSKKQLMPLDVAKLPAAVREFWGAPPLFPSESEDAYWSFAAAIAHGIEPDDPIVWLQVKDFVDYGWEIQRLRRYKAHLAALEKRDRERKSVDATATDAAYHASEVGEADLLLARLASVEAINDLIRDAERRRAAVLSEIEGYRKALAARLRERSDHAIIDGEFTEQDSGSAAIEAKEPAAPAAPADRFEPDPTRPDLG